MYGKNKMMANFYGLGLPAKEKRHKLKIDGTIEILKFVLFYSLPHSISYSVD